MYLDKLEMVLEGDFQGRHRAATRKGSGLHSEGKNTATTTVKYMELLCQGTR